MLICLIVRKENAYTFCKELLEVNRDGVCCFCFVLIFGCYIFVRGCWFCLAYRKLKEVKIIRTCHNQRSHNKP